MFRRDKMNTETDSNGKTEAVTAAAPGTPEAGEASDLEGADDEALQAPPPLKPFSRKGSHSHNPVPKTTMGVTNSVPAKTAYRADIPRRPVDLPASSARHEVLRPRGGEEGNKRLTVGRDISLSGEITDCDKLVIEGRVDANLNGVKIIEITASGVFRGSATVQDADVSGRVEGDLTVTNKLTIRNSGQVSGSVRYSCLVVEAGGQICGTVDPINGGPSSAV